MVTQSTPLQLMAFEPLAIEASNIVPVELEGQLQMGLLGALGIQKRTLLQLDHMSINSGFSIVSTISCKNLAPSAPSITR